MAPRGASPPPAPGLAPATGLDRALVRRFGADLTVEQTLNPGLIRWRRPDALVAYARGRLWPGGAIVRVTAGGPVCAPDRLGSTAAAFERDAAEAGEGVCWFGIDDRVRGALPTHTALVIGAQPIWSPRRWPDILATTASLRAQIHRARNKGVVVERWSQSRAASSIALRAVLHDWLEHKGLPPLHFLAEPDVLDHLGDREVFVAKRGACTEAFLLLAPVPARNGMFVEWIIRRAGAPNGTPSLLLDEVFRHAVDRGTSVLSLGLVPLSTYAPLSRSAPPPTVRAALSWMRAHARRFYNFEGLERFKAKFRPEGWETSYLLSPNPQVSLPLLHAVADAFAGPDQSPEALVGRALRRAAADEARAALDWLSSRGRRT